MSIAIPAQPARTVAVCWSATVNSAASCFSVRYRWPHASPRITIGTPRTPRPARRVADRRVARSGELRGDRQQVLEDAFEVEVGDERASRLEQPSQPRLVEASSSSIARSGTSTGSYGVRICGFSRTRRRTPSAHARVARPRLGAMVTDSRTKVLVAGGGVAGLEAMLALQAIAPRTVRHRARDPATPRHVPLALPPARPFCGRPPTASSSPPSPLNTASG